MSRGAGPSFLPPVLTGPALAARLAPIEVTGNTTATIDRVHIVTATATLTDPTPVQGRGYEVIVRNGTLTLPGPVSYGVGLKIRRYYHSGAWSNEVEPSYGSVAPVDGRVVFNSGGRQADNANMLFSASASLGALSGPAITIGSNAVANRFLILNASSGSVRYVGFTTDGSRRWSFGAESTVEGGAGAGSNFVLTATQDDGTTSDNVLSVTRATGGAAVWTRTVTVPNGTSSAPGLRLTSEASGLYRVSATSLGFAVAGTAAASLTSGGVFTAIGGLFSGVSGVAAQAINSSRHGVVSDQNSTFGWRRSNWTANDGFVTELAGAPGAETWRIAWHLASGPTTTTILSMTSAGVVTVPAATASTSTATGALVVSGGIGVAGQATVRREAYATATISTTGAIASLASDDGFTRLTGAAPDVQGIANPGASAARRIVLYCVNATTLRHENGTAAAADRITSDTAADIAVAAGKTVELIYDPTSSRWRPIRY